MRNGYGRYFYHLVLRRIIYLFFLSTVLSAVGGNVHAQTLLTGANSNFTSAQTTTITAVDANTNPLTYRSGNMNDVLGGGVPSTFLLGTGPAVVNDGVATVRIGATTYTAGAGDTYANSAFLLNTGNFASPASAVTASTAGVAFRLLGNEPAQNTAGY